ncbi:MULTISPECIES: sensor histidine kinase [Geobacter]|uniref:sensor histidine kinase n=1 Tax=Geobacter TaxID=28231 RepID=UPI00257228DD|nr:sensor histidine kinase [Geobacter sulfurreducens]BEH11762.1 sensor histidine kinase [Geobacter sulfurreducens subsp. ethanolicus]BET59622.1 sensor histidine kinase [Geobacter sp. 60473]
MEWKCCWNRNVIEPADCPNIGEGEEILFTSLQRRVIEKCVDCPLFAEDLKTLRGSEHPLATVLPLVVAELQEQRSRVQSMVGFLDSKDREIKFLHEISLVLQTSVDLDEVLSVVMTAITAGKGFGMNRAFLLLTDKERKHLRGYLGVGPRNYGEAWFIWDEISRDDFTLKEMAKNFYQTKFTSEKQKFHDILENLTIPLSEHDHILVRALREKKPLLVENAFHNPDCDYALTQILGVDTFLITPLVSRNRRIGVIISDNCVTHKPITPQDVQSLETFAFPVAFAIERASLYERLQEELLKVTAANVKLKEQQELIVRMERMALVGKITSSIAHSIRNPLMIIGGFARTLLKGTDEGDPRREYLESIVREARQLDEVLDEVLSYSDSLYPTLDSWDVNQLVSTGCRELDNRLQERRIACRLRLDAELPSARIDYKQVSFCLRSILTSSMDRMPDGGEIVIETRLEGGWIVVEVRDTGRPGSSNGMSTFSSFAPPQELGGGLGLEVCKTIMEKHGNSLIIETPPHAGARYVLKLPVNKEEEPHGTIVGG